MVQMKPSETLSCTCFFYLFHPQLILPLSYFWKMKNRFPFFALQEEFCIRGKNSWYSLRWTGSSWSSLPSSLQVVFPSEEQRVLATKMNIYCHILLWYPHSGLWKAISPQGWQYRTYQNYWISLFLGTCSCLGLRGNYLHSFLVPLVIYLHCRWSLWICICINETSWPSH